MSLLNNGTRFSDCAQPSAPRRNWIRSEDEQSGRSFPHKSVSVNAGARARSKTSNTQCCTIYAPEHTLLHRTHASEFRKDTGRHLLEDDGGADTMSISPERAGEERHCEHVVDHHHPEVAAASVHHRALDEGVSIPRNLRRYRMSPSFLPKRLADRA
eukprot:1641184-Rhodomonas_salina.1